MRVDSERQAIIPGSSWPLFGRGVRIERLARKKALVYVFEMLKFLIVKPKKKRGDLPVIVPVRAKMFDRQNPEQFAKVALERYAVQQFRVVGSGVIERFVERR